MYCDLVRSHNRDNRGELIPVFTDPELSGTPGLEKRGTPRRKEDSHDVRPAAPGSDSMAVRNSLTETTQGLNNRVQ